jgi:hypothetical protein
VIRPIFLDSSLIFSMPPSTLGFRSSGFSRKMNRGPMNQETTRVAKTTGSAPNIQSE